MENGRTSCRTPAAKRLLCAVVATGAHDPVGAGQHRHVWELRCHRSIIGNPADPLDRGGTGRHGSAHIEMPEFNGDPDQRVAAVGQVRAERHVDLRWTVEASRSPRERNASSSGARPAQRPPAKRSTKR